MNTDGDPTSALLKNCASTPEDFYLLTSPDQIIGVFNTIGTYLSKLFISQ
ncbi:MAG: hypothetical protein ACR2K5_10150 [Pseudolabrys sp.]